MCLTRFVLLGAFLWIFSCSGVLANEKNMVFAIDVIRHGDRAPIDPIPTAPYIGPVRLGELTPTGMEQEYRLGCKLHDRYTHLNHLLPEHYSSETMYVRSTDIDRTLISAECALLGLYPQGTGPTVNSKAALPFSYQPIPIHTKPRQEDNLLIVDFNPKLVPTVDQYVHSTAIWKEKDASLQPKLAHWNAATGMHMDGLRSVAGLGDTIHIYKLHHVALPKELTEPDVTQILNDTEWAFAESFKPHQVGDLVSHELLKTITDYLEQATQQKSKLKYVLFSAHDTTISSLMSILRDPVDRRPPYSSDLNFALFKEGSDYKVKISLNDKPVTVPGFKDGEGTIKDLTALLESKD
jgi:lysosomal acid phosphatase